MSAPQEHPTRVHKSVTRVPHKSVPQEGAPQEWPTRVPHESVRREGGVEEWPTRMPRKREHARGLYKSVQQEYRARVSCKRVNVV